MGFFSDANKRRKKGFMKSAWDAVYGDAEEPIDYLVGGEGDVADIFGRQEGRDARAAEEEAAQVQETEADRALAEYRRQFDISQENLAPWLEAGTGALGLQQDFLGLSGQDAQSQAYANYQESPGQKFLRERGERAVLQNAAAIGGLGGGRVRAELNKQGIGFAAQDFGNHFNRLAGLSNTGQQTGQQMGAFGQNYAGNAAQQYGLIGNSRASGIFGAQQARANTNAQTQGVLKAGAKFFTSDERLKDDIKKISTSNGYNIYSWVWNDLHFDKSKVGKKDSGVIAQEVEKILPSAVSTHKSGFKMVDYNKIGVAHG